MPERFTALHGAAVPLFRPNIDTDTISPGSRPIGSAAGVPRPDSSRLAGELFANWRYAANGNEDPTFVLNRPEFAGAPILIGGRNFGCGSSRESAVWMLKDWGFRCIVAPSFGEIFYGSCFNNGILPVRLDEPTVAAFAAEADPGAPTALFHVDLTRNEIRAPSGTIASIVLPNIRRQALLAGLDEIEQTLQRAEAIDRFESSSPPFPATFSSDT